MKTTDINTIRETAGLTQKVFAERLGVPLSRVKYWQQIDRIALRPEVVRRLADICEENEIVVCPFCDHPTLFKNLRRPTVETFGLQCSGCTKVYTVDRYNNRGVYRW